MVVWFDIDKHQYDEHGLWNLLFTARYFNEDTYESVDIGTRIELLQGWDHIGVIHFLHLKLYFKAFLVGGFNPSENMKVSWDDYSQHMEI